jgi:hypothetical protein
MGSQNECVEPTLLPPIVQGHQIRVEVVDPIAIRWVLLGIPDFWYWELFEESTLNFTFIVDAIKTNHSLEEDVQLWVAGWVFGDFKEWLENVFHHLFKRIHQATSFVDVVKARDLDQPAHVVRKKLVVNYPGGKLIPLIYRFTIDGDTPLNHLILARFKIRNDFLRYLGEVTAVDEVICLEENCPETRLSNWVILEIKLIESMERVGVSLQLLVANFGKLYPKKNE